MRTVWKYIRARWYIYLIVRHLQHKHAGKRVSNLVIPADVADLVYEIAIEAGERDWICWLLALPRE